jgi:hypothetical protein
VSEESSSDDEKTPYKTTYILRLPKNKKRAACVFKK